jgi:hypothetical protein
MKRKGGSVIALKDEGVLEIYGGGIWAGSKQAFATPEDFVQAINGEADEIFDIEEYATKVSIGWMRGCVGACNDIVDEPGEFHWHLEETPGRGRSPAWVLDLNQTCTEEQST